MIARSANKHEKMLRKRLNSTLIGAFAAVLAACGGDDGAVPRARPSLDAPDALPNVLPQPALGRPLNVIVILADDLGYTDIGAYGSEIPTPNLDLMAQRGTVFTNFYTSSSCAPSRAMLMSGMNPHSAGIGAVAGIITDKKNPSYLGHLSTDVASMGEVMQLAGYSTLVAGKWDLGMDHQSSPAARGFDRSFVVLNSAAGHFANQTGLSPRYPTTVYRDGYALVDDLPPDFYSTDAFTTKIIDFIDSRPDSRVPFLAYLAFTAPHWPLQAPDDWVAKFKGKYDDGFAPILEARLAQARANGIIDGPVDASEKIASLEAFWEALDAEGRASAARRMEVYAAMVAKLDEQIGQLLDYLERTNQADDTVILFTSDNGADFSNTETMLPIRRWVHRHFDNSIENMGRENSYISYGKQWAMVSAGPLRFFKGTTSEGGIRAPAILYWPGALAEGETEGRVTSRFTTLMDVLPTATDIAGIRHPGLAEGSEVLPPEGRSFADLLHAGNAGMTPNLSDPVTVVWESMGTVAIRKADWKLAYIPGWLGEGRWALYNLAEDPFETTDLSRDHPKLVRELRQYWQTYEKHHQVRGFPWFLRYLLFGSRPPEFREAARQAD